MGERAVTQGRCSDVALSWAAADPAELKVDDIVLVKVRGRDYLHLVKAVNSGRFQDREESRAY